MPGIDFSSAFSETQEKVWEPRSFTLSSFWTNSVSKCFWCQMHINSRSKLKNQVDLQNIRASRFPRRLPFGLRQSFFELHFLTTHSFHCGFLCWAEVCDSFKKKKKTPGTRVLSKWGIRCESDTTMLKGCKQPERNIASSNSCVALVMIFQEALTKTLQNTLPSPITTRKRPKTAGHVHTGEWHNFTRSADNQPLALTIPNPLLV